MDHTNASARSSAGKAVENLENSRYDAEVKNFLSEKSVLAVILKNCVEEFRDCSWKDIAEKYIEGTPQVGIVGVDVDETNPAADSFGKIRDGKRADVTDDTDAAADELIVGDAEDSSGSKIQGASNEHTTKTEGTVYYDIRFLAQAPGNAGSIQMIINVEAQKNDTPGYPITKRGFFYTGRMVSAQKNVEFTKSHYGNGGRTNADWGGCKTSDL